MPVQAATGQGYGVAGEQRAAQRAVPVAAPPGPMLDFSSPVSARPGEPVTQGAALGAGAGLEVLPAPMSAAEPADILRALYRLAPSEDLRELLEDADEGVGF